jgi:uncharacterized iron-regulated membrane protein
VFPNLRIAMAWVHTWFGLLLGFVLMVCFFFGSLSVFDREIDRWTVPSSRFAPQPLPSFESVLRPVFERMHPLPDEVAALRNRLETPVPDRLETVNYWSAYTTHRDPVLDLYAGFDVPDSADPDEEIYTYRTIDPRNGSELPHDQLKIGSGFFYPMHYSLTLEWRAVGYWIVGLAALTMLVALVTGVVIHRKFFRELFTLRPGAAGQRSTLDLHNLSGVVALPFHFFFAFTGLLIFAQIYFPVTETQLHELHDLHEKQGAAESGLPHERAGIAAPIGNVDAMVAEARRRWQERGMGGEVGYLELRHPGDANGYVSVYRAGTDRIALAGEGIHFRASTGELLHEDPPATAVGSINDFLTGLHLQHFRHWLLRWLYLLGGLTGCVCIATGFLFFVEKRRRQHAASGRKGARLVDALAVATVTGMPSAALALLVVNRLLPEQLPAGWTDRGELERYAFWGAWLVLLLHALVRGATASLEQRSPAWREQCRVIVVLALAAVLSNWITTGDHLGKTLAEPYWPVAGVDLFLLATALIAGLAARRLAGRPEVATSDALEAGHV